LWRTVFRLFSVVVRSDVPRYHVMEALWNAGQDRSISGYLKYGHRSNSGIPQPDLLTEARYCSGLLESKSLPKIRSTPKPILGGVDP
jgi:hypothetical protein